jgi:primosomal protein N' (replication factor Y) (superfamily II helicase)
VAVGQNVIAPFGRRKQHGYIIELTDIAPPGSENFTIKEIDDIADPTPLFKPKLLELLNWISSYYVSPLGNVLQTAIPTDTRLKKQIRIDATSALIPFDDVSDFIATEQSTTLSILKTKFPDIPVLRRVTVMNTKGMITLENEFKEPKTRASDTLILLDSSTEESSLSRSKKQTELFHVLVDFPDGIPRSALTKDYGFSSAIIKTFLDKGYCSTQDIAPSLFIESSVLEGELSLTDEQQLATDEICRAMESATFAPFLLQGVTGSGKTEVYISATKKALDQGRNVLILVPEIALAPHIARRFQQYFGKAVALWHSNMTREQKSWVWEKLRIGQYQILVGPRSAILTPLDNIGLIIVDEEHEGSYKQTDREPYYHARDIALVRAKIEEATVVLGSATPSLESYFNAKNDKLQKLELLHRWTDVKPPIVELVDMNKELNETKDFTNPFSRHLLKEVQDTIDEGHQVILLQNRRGYAPVVKCLDCGWVLACPQDEVTMTYHKNGHKMRCHYCDYQCAPPSACATCASHNLHLGGFGTQRVEELLEHAIPNVRILRMDTDTTSQKGAHDKMLNAFARHEYDILLGTQMIAKGLDFENVTLVGVVNADSGLHQPDFRAGERTFQLVSQVSGRSGRGKYAGKVSIQTWQPNHYAIQNATRQDVKSFYNLELEQRKQLDYPPFSRLVSLSFSGVSRNDVIQVAEECAYLAQQYPVIVMGPVPGLIERLHQRFHWKIILKSPKSDDASGAKLRQTARAIYTQFKSKTVRLKIDIDPQSLLQ